MPWKDEEKKREGGKTYYEKNKEVIRARQKEYYQKNRNKLLKQAKEKYDREYHKQYYQSNKEHLKAVKKKWNTENKEKVNQYSYAQQKKAFEKDPDKVRAQRRERKKAYKAKNPKHYNAIANKSNRKTSKASVSELRDCYIKQLLCKHGVVTRLSAKEIPQELVEVKRLEIQIRRLLNEKRK